MANILIASLGKSPIVVTAMIKAMKEQKDILFDQILLLYPEKQETIKDGINLIEKHCLCKNIQGWPLSFEDPNSEDHCVFFLKTLYGILEEQQENAVYLSLAGGRKSMSSLMYLPASFYDNIKGVYHILDKEEGTINANFHDLDDLIDEFLLDDPELEEIMNPPSESMSLIDIPFEHLANADDFRKIIMNIDFNQAVENFPVEIKHIDSDALEFWQTIFKKHEISSRYSIWFSENAKNQFKNQNINHLNFSRYFTGSKLKNHDWANKSGKNGGKHVTHDGKKSNHKFFIAKISRTAERVVWYKDPIRDVVVAEFGVENDNKQYQRVGGNVILDENYFSQKIASDYEAKYRLHDLPRFGSAILLATLGKSPMVVTQAYTLLEHFENINIDKIGLVYPKLNPDICNGVDVLQKAFTSKNVEVLKFGIDIEDVNDNITCEIFLSNLIHKINDLHKSFSDANFRMLLSGGRKGMSALSLLAAQSTNIKNVYHVLITSPELEKQIEHEGQLKLIRNLKSDKERARVLFLENYTNLLDNNFTLFKIPVIPLSLK